MAYNKANVDMSLFEDVPKKTTDMSKVDMSLFGEKPEDMYMPPTGGGAGGQFDEPNIIDPVAGVKRFIGREVENAKSMGRIVAGGVLNMAEGFGTLGYDISSEIGPEDARKKASKMAAEVRRVIPNIEPDGTLEAIGQKVVQYGLPAGTAIKLTHGVLQKSPWAVQFMGELFSGGLADFASATPDDEPIAISAETPLGKRVGIGVEGTVIPAAIRPVGKVVGAVGRGLGRTAKYMWKPKVVAEDAIGSALVEQSLDPVLALKNIKQYLRDGSDLGVERTTGTVSNDIGLVGMEKGLASKGDTAAELLQRKEMNFRTIGDALEEVTDTMGGDGQRARAYFEKFVDDRISGGMKSYEVAEAAVRSAEKETDNLIDEFAMKGGKQADASMFIDSTVKDELTRLTAKKNDLYKKIDPNYEVIIPKQRLQEAYKALMAKHSQYDTVAQNIDSELKQILTDDLAIKKSKGGEGFPDIGDLFTAKTKEKPLTFGALTDLRGTLSDAIKKARTADQGEVVLRLTTFKKAVEAETEHLMLEGGPAAQRAIDANEFYVKEFLPKFRQGVGDTFRKNIRKGTPFYPTETGNRFIATATGASENAVQLKNIISGSKNAPEAAMKVRDHIVSSVADLMQTSKGTTAANRLVSFLNQRPVRETLDQFPSIKKEIMQFKNQLGTSLEKQSRFAKDLDSAKTALKKTEKDMKKSAASFYVDVNPVKAMGAVLRSADPESNMAKLVRLAKQDPSGDALKGLKASLSDYLKRELTGTREIGGTLEVMKSKVVEIFKRKETRNAMSALYSKQEMAVLDNIHKELQIMDRVNKQVTSNSSTKPIAEQIQRARVVLASFYGIVKGRGIFAISNWIMKLAGRDPETIANRVITDAMLDPELAAKLMTKEIDKKASQRAKEYLTAYIANNLVQPITENQEN